MDSTIDYEFSENKPLAISVQEKVANLPQKPGVYMHKDSNGVVLYVGKAKKLKNRVKSYFQESRPHDGRIRIMVSKIADLEVIVTDSEAEALILENNLIKKYRPKYNVMYRDDKSYPYICVTPGEKPRIFPTRHIIKNGSKYYGPYDNVGLMKSMLEIIRISFGLCTCACSQKTLDQSRSLPKWHNCFNEYFEKCSGDWDLKEYQTAIQRATRLLNGRSEELIRELKEEMLIASDALAFEDAAKIRDGIVALQKYSEKMKMVLPDLIDRDVFGVYSDREENIACGVLFKIRQGKLLGKTQKLIKQIEDYSEAQLLQIFMEDYYTGGTATIIPDEVLISTDLEDESVLFDYLHGEKGRNVSITVPKIGEKAQMIRLTLANAKHVIGEYQLEQMKEKHDRIPHSIKALERDLYLNRLPRRIECFDNSNFQGSDPVASMVCFLDGEPRKAEYKRFSIKTVEGPNDFASMAEIVTRRYSRVLADGLQIPDLIIVDGGKGQLSAAVEALKAIGFFGQVPIIGLAKRLEEVFFPYKSDSIMLPKTSSGLKLLQRVRDEAHRFAITFHREKRSKRTFLSELEEIPGIGKTTASKLIKTFGSVKQLRQTPIEELNKLIGLKTANALKKWIRESESELKEEE
ncbi:MAG: excinuclease ABC subunit C [Bacteroidetes bacterium]|nr:excinuclease ABC subunit C [Bacteroidota bacterium]